MFKSTGSANTDCAIRNGMIERRARPKWAKTGAYCTCLPLSLIGGPHADACPFPAAMAKATAEAEAELKAEGEI